MQWPCRSNREVLCQALRMSPARVVTPRHGLSHRSQLLALALYLRLTYSEKQRPATPREIIASQSLGVSRLLRQSSPVMKTRSQTARTPRPRRSSSPSNSGSTGFLPHLKKTSLSLFLSTKINLSETECRDSRRLPALLMAHSEDLTRASMVESMAVPTCMQFPWLDSCLLTCKVNIITILRAVTTMIIRCVRLNPAILATRDRRLACTMHTPRQCLMVHKWATRKVHT